MSTTLKAFASALGLTPAILLAASLAAQADSSPGFSARLAFDTPVVTDSRTVNVTVTFTNASTHTQCPQVAHAVLGSFDAEMFLVDRDNVPVPYMGRLVKRGPPLPEDFLFSLRVNPTPRL